MVLTQKSEQARNEVKPTQTTEFNLKVSKNVRFDMRLQNTTKTSLSTF